MQKKQAKNLMSNLPTVINEEYMLLFLVRYTSISHLYSLLNSTAGCPCWVSLVLEEMLPHGSVNGGKLV